MTSTRLALALLLLIGMSPVSAESEPGDIEGGDREARDRSNYLFSCRGCHLADGRGVPPEVPTLRDALGELLQHPEGRDYLVRVPGVAQSRLNDEALAAVLNYVLREFNAQTLSEDFQPFTAQEVATLRQETLANPLAYRERMLKDLSLAE